MRCPTCPPIPADMFRIASQLTCPRQRPFRDPGTRTWYSASYPATATWRSSHDRCGFLLAFAHRHSLLGHPVPARRVPPFLTVGLPHRHSGPDSVGVPAFRTCETRPGWVSSLLRGGGVLPTGAASPIGACRFPTACPCTPLPLPTTEPLFTRHQRRFTRFTRPVCLSPVTPGWDGRSFGFPLGLRTLPLPATHAKGGARHRARARNYAADVMSALLILQREIFRAR